VIPPLPLRSAAERHSGGALRGLARLPFQCRRRGLQLLFSTVARPLVGSPPRALVRRTARALGLSDRESERFLYRSLLHDALFHMEWLALAGRSKPGLIADSRHITSPSHDELAWLAAQPGALIGTMHFGPYSLGLVWLLHRYFEGRRIVVVKTQTDDPDEARAIARLGELGAQVEFVAPDRPEQFHLLVKRVREGAVGIIMVDLPPSYGRSTPFDLLGHQLSFASGVVDLAALCAAPLMLFRTCSDVTSDTLEVFDLFDVLRDPDSRERAMGRIGHFVTNSLLEHPDHWHMWGRFEEYLAPLQEAVR
jgi:lauroyl/myristoyl acyltransferase